MTFEVRAGLEEAGRTIYNDGIARAADIGDDRFVFECSGYSVECDALDIVEAATALIRRVGGKLSLLDAAHAVVFDIEERLPAEAEVDG